MNKVIDNQVISWKKLGCAWISQTKETKPAGTLLGGKKNRRFIDGWSDINVITLLNR